MQGSRQLVPKADTELVQPRCQKEMMQASTVYQLPLQHREMISDGDLDHYTLAMTFLPEARMSSRFRWKRLNAGSGAHTIIRKAVLGDFPREEMSIELTETCIDTHVASETFSGNTISINKDLPEHTKAWSKTRLPNKLESNGQKKATTTRVGKGEYETDVWNGETGLWMEDGQCQHMPLKTHGYRCRFKSPD